jgi:hypothetical protein
MRPSIPSCTANPLHKRSGVSLHKLIKVYANSHQRERSHRHVCFVLAHNTTTSMSRPSHSPLRYESFNGSRNPLECKSCSRVFVVPMAVVYYPYPTPYFKQNFYLQGPYPPWMARPAYSSKGLSEMRYRQPPVSDGGLSEFGLSGLNYGQRKWIQPAPMISSTYYPMMMTSMPAMIMGQPMIMSPSFYPAASPMSYSEPQWFQPVSMFTY